MVIKRLLFFEICTDNEILDVKLWKLTYKGDKVLLHPLKFLGKQSLEQWKHYIAILLVTGDQVISKKYIEDDVSIKKIVENENLLWEVSSINTSEEQILSFLRKELLQSFLDDLVINRIHLLKILISQTNILDKDQLLHRICLEEMSFGVIRKSIQKINLVFELLYHKYHLPILLSFLLILLGNYFINVRLRQQKKMNQTQLEIVRKNNEAKQKAESSLNRLVVNYNKVPNCSFSTIADKIASYVPSNLSLNVLSIFPYVNKMNFTGKYEGQNIRVNIIIIKGWVETPGSITLFSQLLNSDALFTKVDILSLVKRKKENLFDFEMQIAL